MAVIPVLDTGMTKEGVTPVLATRMTGEGAGMTKKGHCDELKSQSSVNANYGIIKNAKLFSAFMQEV